MLGTARGHSVSFNSDNHCVSVGRDPILKNSVVLMGSGASISTTSAINPTIESSCSAASKPLTTPNNPRPPDAGGFVRRASQFLKGLTLQATPPKDCSTRNMQEEANSFRSKAGTLKMLIRNKNSRKAFFNFIEKTHKGKEELLDYFLYIESIKNSKDSAASMDSKSDQFVAIVAQYEKKASGKECESPEAIIFNSTHTWKDIKTLPSDELQKHMTRSQDEVLIAITPMFESFLLSNYYQEFDRNEMANERRSYVSSVPVE